MGLLSILIHRYNLSLEIAVCCTTIYIDVPKSFLFCYSQQFTWFFWQCNYITCPCLWYINQRWMSAPYPTCLFPYGHISSPNEMTWSNVLRPMINRSTEFRKSAKPISPSASDADDWYWSENQIRPFVRCNHQLLWRCRLMPSFSHPSLEGKKLQLKNSLSVAFSLLLCCQVTNIAA